MGRFSREVLSPSDGYLTSLDAEKVGYSACILGAGRLTKDDTPDLSAGIVLRKQRGDFVKAGEPLAVLYTSDESRLDDAEAQFLSGAVIQPP